MTVLKVNIMGGSSDCRSLLSAEACHESSTTYPIPDAIQASGKAPCVASMVGSWTNKIIRKHGCSISGASTRLLEFYHPLEKKQPNKPDTVVNKEASKAPEIN